MDALKLKYNDYLRIVDCRAVYTLADGTVIDFTYKKENFIHLTGLHKLTDIQLIQFLNDKSNKTVKVKDVLRKIKNEEFTESMVRGSLEFSKIEKRYDNLTYDKLTSLTYTDAIINFNAASAKSIIKSDYLLYEQEGGGYNHLGIAIDNSVSKRYIETFFNESTDRYVKGQTAVRVAKFSLYDATGNLIVDDAF